MRKTFGRGGITATALGVITLATAGLVSVAGPAQANLYNPIPANADGDPTDQFTHRDALFAYTTTDVEGGEICIVPDEPLSDDASENTCEDRTAWGTPNTILGVGTSFTLIEGPPLRPGTWRLMTTPPEESETRGENAHLSEPFTVEPCRPANGCDPTIGAQEAAAFKAASRKMELGTGVICAGANLEAYRRSANTAGEVVGKATGEGIYPLIGAAVAVDAKTIEADYTGVAQTVAGFVGDVIEVAAFILEPEKINEEIALSLLEHVSCGAEQMYSDIVADPPDPDFAHVLQPGASTFPDVLDAHTEAVLKSLDRQRSLAHAVRVAYERYQGAVAAGDGAGQVRQAAAIAEFGQQLRVELGTSADATDAWAADVRGDSALDQPIYPDQATKDKVVAVRERIRNSGFSKDEQDLLRSVGFDTPAALEAARENLGLPMTDVPVGGSVSQSLTDAADEMRAQQDAVGAFANAAAVAAATDVPTDENHSPVAAFTSKASSDPHEVAFDASGSTDSDGSVTGYAWDFGDETKGDGAFPVHEYAKAGTYTVTLTVTDDDGASNSTSAPVVVQRSAPTAVIAAQPDALTVHLDGTGSTAPEGSIASYNWNFGDGSSGSGAKVDHTYATAGTYTVTLTVTDDAGGQATAKSIVTVVPAPPVNVPPQASFTSSAKEPQEPHEISFDASGSTDADGSIVIYAWDFGDGTKGTGVSPVHEYGKVGTYSVRLTVTDDDGATGTQSAQVEVKRLPPTAGFTAKVDDDSPLRVHFDGTKSGASEGSITAYDWDFGDGSSGTGSTADHTYAAPGTYKATLTVTDDSGMKAMAQSDVTVTAGPPPNQPPVASFTVKGEAVAPAALTFDASDSRDPDGSVVSYSWGFGDGVKATGKIVAHTFTLPGTYSVSLTVTDDDGASTTSIISVVVSEPEMQGAMCDGHPATIVGDGGAVIRGTRRDDVIVGTSAAEEIHGGGGNDIICAGGGDDTVFADDGKDVVFGGAGNDTLSGGDGADALHGGDGADTIHGDAGKDDVKGDAGDDHLFGDAARDVLFGGMGNDTVSGGDSDDQLYGQDGDDSLHGDDGDDVLHGGPGTDQLDGGSGRNVLEQD